MTTTTDVTVTDGRQSRYRRVDTEVEFPSGDDLALSRATDFYSLDELLSDDERAIRDRVRVWVDTEVSPIAADYWEAARFPVELVEGTASWASPAARSSVTAARGCRTWPRG